MDLGDDAIDRYARGDASKKIFHKSSVLVFRDFDQEIMLHVVS